MCRCEFTATPATSPRYMPAGSLRSSVLPSNRISGTACWAVATGAAAAISSEMVRPFTGSSFAAVIRRPQIWRRELSAGSLQPSATPAASRIELTAPAASCGLQAGPPLPTERLALACCRAHWIGCPHGDAAGHARDVRVGQRRRPGREARNDGRKAHARRLRELVSKLTHCPVTVRVRKEVLFGGPQRRQIGDRLRPIALLLDGAELWDRRRRQDADDDDHDQQFDQSEALADAFHGQEDAGLCITSPFHPDYGFVYKGSLPFRLTMRFVDFELRRSTY